MADEFIEKPVRISDALGRSDELSLLTMAAFLLTTAVWHIPELQEVAFPPEDDLGELGFLDWKRGESIERGGVDIQSLGIEAPFGEEPEANRDDYYARLSEQIWRALKSGSAYDTVQAVAFGLSAPDEIVRICALVSAADLIRPRGLYLWRRLGWFLGRELADITRQLLGIVIARLFALGLAVPPPPASPAAQGAKTPGLMLIHGTVLPTSQSNRPVWSVPGTGPLFNHIQGFRSDIYGSSDYFRWEGGYTDYAREVASQNLNDWTMLRQLSGIDAVAHSHGCNVLMASTGLNARFGKVVLLSCPVHWHKYSIGSSAYSRINSVRIRFDFVILADRGGQRFPSGTIKETLLPLWFVSHSDTTRPSVWKNHGLDALIT